MSENKGSILVSQFVKEYSEITNEGQRKQYLKKHITRTYCPLFEKMNMLKIMNDKAVVDNEDTEKYINMTVSKLNTMIAVLILYTDIKVEKDEENKPKTWECYDLLQSTGLFSKILEFIGKDIEELMLVQKEVMDTWHMKNSSTRAFITSLVNKSVDRFGVVTGAGMQELSNILDDEQKMNKAYSLFDNFLNKIRK